MYNGPQPIPPSAGGGTGPTPAYILVYLSAIQTTTSGTQATVKFDTVGASKNLSLNADGSVTITQAGIYHVQFASLLTTVISGATGLYYFLTKNGTAQSEFTVTLAGFNCSFTGGCLVQCAVGDVLNMQIMQLSGSNKSLSNSGAGYTFLHISRIPQ